MICETGQLDNANLAGIYAVCDDSSFGVPLRTSKTRDETMSGVERRYQARLVREMIQGGLIRHMEHVGGNIPALPVQTLDLLGP